MLMFSSLISKLAGFMPAIPTPFAKDGEIDAAAFEWLCDHQIKHGAAALVVCGTTGEAPTLTPAEHRKLIRLAVGVSGGRIPIIAGAGSNATAHGIELTRDAEAVGADAILSVVPYYNKPTRSGIYWHFRAIGQSTALPIILYDVPTRTVSALADETLCQLAEIRQFIGVKDASGDVTRPLRLRSLLGPEFRLFSGDDATAFAFIAQGGNGCISVTSNVAPGLCRAMYAAQEQGQISQAQELASAVTKLTAVLFRESNPAPVKYALSLMHIMLPRVRLPLVEPKSETKAEIDATLAQMYEKYSGYLVGKPLWLEKRATEAIKEASKPKLVVVS